MSVNVIQFASFKNYIYIYKYFYILYIEFV